MEKSPFLPHLGPGTLSLPTRQQTWQPLQVFGLYRLLLALILTGLYFSGLGPSFLGEHRPHLYALTSIVYLGLAGLAAGAVRAREPTFRSQVFLQVLGDIVMLSLLMHASGGIGTGLGLLILISVMAGSLLLPGRQAYFFAAVASISILVEGVYAHLVGSFETTTYSQAGMLGTAFFAGATIAHLLASRARSSELLAAQRGIDLANMERLNERIIRYLDTGILVADQDRRVRLINNDAWHLLGMPGAGEGQPLERVSPELDRQLADWLEDPERMPEPFQPNPSGTPISPRFVLLGNTTAAGILIFLEDLSRTAQRAQQIKLASLGRLTGSIAHEIRNPLGALSHAAQLLQTDDALDAAQQRRLADIIHRQTRRMNSLVENVLQISRRDPAHVQVLDLEPWLQHFTREFVLERSLETERFTLEVEPRDTQILFDPNHLHQILGNLFENALRYGKDSTGHLDLTLRGGITRESQGPFLDVMDTGPGIAPDAVTQVFEPFFTTGDTLGSGLGLYIARDLAELNQARLEYLALPTAGSCFRLSFADPRRIAIPA